MGAGRYLLSTRKGGGGAGDVWSAWDDRLQRHVAVKILRRTDGEMLSRFRQEALATAALAHPNIVKVTDYFVEDGVSYLVMELLDGVSLAELVRAVGPLDPRRAAVVVMQVSAALELAHARGVIHRDVKPANIQVISTANGEQAKLLDLGIAKLLDATTLTAHGSTLGTPGFMAPEQATGSGVGPESDVFSAGVTLYFLLCGKLPYSGTTPQEILAQLVTGSVRPLGTVRPDLDASLVAIVERATAHARELRYATASELRSALAAWLGNATLSEPPPPQIPTSQIVAHALPTAVEPAVERRQQRRIAWLIGAIAAAGLGVAGLAAAAALWVSRDFIEPAIRTQPPRAASAASAASPVDAVSAGAPTAQPAPSTPVAPMPAATRTGKTSSTRPSAAPAQTATAPARRDCPASYVDCGVACKNIRTDRAHCGACNNACPATRVCRDSSCVECPTSSGYAICAGRCIEVTFDRANCGSCGNACPHGRACMMGTCR